MTAAIVPFRDAARRRADDSLANSQRETIRQTRRLIFECRQARAESAAIQRRYLERQARIEVLLAGIHTSVEGEGG